MFCPNCGIEVEDNAKFCPKCGINLIEIKKSENNFNVSNGIKSNGILSFLDDWSEWSTGKKIGSIILVCCIGLIIIGAIGSIISPDVNTSSSDHDTYPSDYEQRYDSYSSSYSSNSKDNSNSHSSDTNDDIGDSDVQVRITCSGGWDGSIGIGTSTSSYSGNGDKTINLDGSSSDIVAAVIQKQSGGNGKLKVEIIKDGKVVKEASTTAGYGVVSVAD